MDSVMKSLPMVALRGLTIMPEMVVHFDVSRERSITAVQQAMMEDQKIFLVAQKSIETEDPGQEDVYSIGTVATVRQVIKLPKKIVRVLVSGEQRGRLTGISEKNRISKRKLNFWKRQIFGIEDEIQKEAMAQKPERGSYGICGQKWKNVQGGSERTDFDRRSEEADQ